MMKLLLVNETEKHAETLASMCSSLRLGVVHVTARFPVVEYLIHLLEFYHKDFVIVNCENIDNGFNVAWAMATKLPTKPIILIHESQERQSGYPENLHIFKTTGEALRHIKNA